MRSKKDTILNLKSIWDDYSTIGNKTKAERTKTEKGVKDTFQEYFLDKLYSSYKNKRAIADKRQALKECIQTMPEATTSPVLRLKGEFVSDLISIEV